MAVSDRHMKIRQTVTEVDLDLDDPKVREVLSSIVAETLGAALDIMRRAPAHTTLSFAPSVSLPEAARGQVPAVETPKASLDTRSRRRTKASARGSAIPEQRKQLVESICGFRGEMREAYNGAIRRQSRLLERAQVVLHLAKEEFKTDGLVTQEIAEILSRGFLTPATSQAVNMALNRAAARTNPTVAGRPATWDRARTEYWLTRAGLDQVSSALAADG